MSPIFGADGKPVASTSNHVAGKSQPVKGEAFGPWAGRDLQYLQMPGGGMVQFDLSRLNLSDFRMMTSHYQVNSSLSVLMFMLHQLEWHIEADDKRVEDHVTENLTNIWSRLVRAMSQSFWAGYSPSVLQWENDNHSGTVQLTKVKDLAPEEAMVNWKEVEANLPPGSPNQIKPKTKVFDGIKQLGVASPIPVTNSFWYPLLMENGNYGGRKLLKSAFQPWFFSTLMHLFSNRYFERFGEPVPVGRAPLNDTVPDPRDPNKEMSGTDYMGQMLQSLRSRSAVVLPSDKAPDTNGNLTSNYDYNIEYMESQMRGADFERYMTRLDEEISLSLFTPLLLMRTADVGSYNLGVSHMQMYLWQLNAISGDWAEYINKYIIAPMARYNFGNKVKPPKIIFHKMGKTQDETTRSVIVELIKQNKVDVDLVELGQAIGLELEEIEQLDTNDTDDDDTDETSVEPSDDSTEDSTDTSENNKKTRFTVSSTQPDVPVIQRMIDRVGAQATKAHAQGRLDGSSGWVPDFGFASHYSELKMEMLGLWHDDLMGAGGFENDKEYMKAFEPAARSILEGETNA